MRNVKLMSDLIRFQLTKRKRERYLSSRKRFPISSFFNVFIFSQSTLEKVRTDGMDERKCLASVTAFSQRKDASPFFFMDVLGRS